MNRRDMLKVAGTAIAGATLLGTQVFANENIDPSVKSKRKKALIIGAHPDDPETGCGGTMLMLRKAGWEVVSAYLTKGHGGIKGKSHDEAASIRTQEAIEACKILDARPLFMTQIDGNAEVTKARYAEMQELIASESPDIVFTHWPIDSHTDHRVCSTLVYNAWRRLDYSFELYYFEVMSGTQSQLFQPTDYVDISTVANLKQTACLCHKSQNMETLYNSWHIPMETFRGLEFRCKRAEAFILLRRNDSDIFETHKK